MSKKCINCGKKISFLDDSFSLPNQRESFCKECGAIAQPLLHDIKIAVTKKSYEDAKVTFEVALPEARLSEEAKKILRYEFDDIGASITGVSVSDTEKQKAMSFNGTFSVCCDAIYKAGKTASGNESVAPMQIVRFSSGNGENWYFVTAVFESYYVRTGSYASLTVTMVWFPQFIKKGRAVVSVVGSGGGSGLFNISWGAETDYEASFWRALRDQNPELEIDEYTETFFDTGIEFMQRPFHDEKTQDVLNFKGGELSDVTSDRIGILGGTFDPVHIGHVALGMAAISEADLDKLIVVPAYIQPFKQGKRVTDDEHRLAMARMAFENVQKAEISTIEIDRMRVSYTFDTLSELKKQYPDKDLFFITGADAFMEIDTWYKGIDLLDNFSFIVSVRPGCPEEDLNDKIKIYKKLHRTNVIKLAAQMPDISSTDIREMYRSGTPISSFVPETVERYIKDNGLYE